MYHKYVVLQDGIKECGSACLMSIIKYYGGNIPLNRLLEMTNTTKEGTNFYNLKEAAIEIGFISKGYKVENIDKMLTYQKPFICQIIINNYNHFVVVYKIKNNKITIMDPAKGIKKITLEDFNKLFTGYVLLLEPIKKLPIIKNENYIINIIKKTIINNKKIIINLIFLTIIVTIATCISSYYFKIIIDKVINTNKINLIRITSIFIIIVSLKNIIEYIRNNLLLYLNKKIDLSIITTTINKIISLPYSYYKNKSTGEIISRVNDLFYIKNIVSKIIITLFLDNILAIILLIILFKINNKLTYILLLITLIYLLIFIIYKKILENSTNDLQESNAKVNSIMIETISGYETIKGLTIENNIKKKVNEAYINNLNKSLFLSKLINSEEFIKDFFEGILTIIIICLGTNCVMDKSITLGSLITYNTLMYYFLSPIRNAFDFYKELYYVKNSIKRINNVLDYKCERLDKIKPKKIKGDIEIKHLNFSYNNSTNILKDISLKIKSSSKTLILGKSGGGKSTILKLLYRYYEVNKNTIYIDNQDILKYNLKDIRQNITYISQQEIIFTDTIKNNIILNRNISEEKVTKLCEILYVFDNQNDNILSYEYPLEENGANISGGQRQRIILARSLLKKSKIIMIDEGLNEIDVNLERKILKNLFTKYQDKTFIIVSHRKDNIDLYDQVIYLENGHTKNITKN